MKYIKPTINLSGEEEALVIKMYDREVEEASQYAHTAEKYGFQIPDFEDTDELLDWYRWALSHEDY